MNTQKIITLENRTKKMFYWKLKIKKNFYGRQKIVTFETNDNIVNYSSDHVFNVNKFPFVYDEEKNYFVRDRKYISIEEN